MEVLTVILIPSMQYRRYNCQGNYTLFYKQELCKKKRLKLVMKKIILMVTNILIVKVQVQKITITIIYNSFQILLIKM